MIRKKKKFEWPRKRFDKPRILNENKLVKKYGLKNKEEIWRTDAKVKYFRNRAKSLITAGQEDQQKFFNNLNKIGLKVGTTADVLALDKEDLLKRRLATIVWSKKFATTPKSARQMIVHKKIMIGKNVVNVPGYLVKIHEDKIISVKKKVKIQKPVVEKINEEVKEEKVENFEEQKQITKEKKND